VNCWISLAIVVVDGHLIGLRRGLSEIANGLVVLLQKLRLVA
jgi:hypothetical protein